MKLGPVELGGGAKIDEGVLLGYPPSRSVADPTLRIGSNAVVRSGTIVYGGSTIGESLETGHYVILREENRIGKRLRIWSHSVIDYGCELGDDVWIHNLVYIAQFTVLEDEVFLAPGAMLANDKYPPKRTRLQGPRIRRRARIGMNATVLPGVVVGEGTLVGAGSVVTRDLPDGVVAYGCPARVAGRAPPRE